jgi:hypothetical protein
MARTDPSRPCGERCGSARQTSPLRSKRSADAPAVRPSLTGRTLIGKVYPAPASAASMPPQSQPSSSTGSVYPQPQSSSTSPKKQPGTPQSAGNPKSKPDCRRSSGKLTNSAARTAHPPRRSQPRNTNHSSPRAKLPTCSASHPIPSGNGSKPANCPDSNYRVAARGTAERRSTPGSRPGARAHNHGQAPSTPFPRPRRQHSPGDARSSRFGDTSKIRTGHRSTEETGPGVTILPSRAGYPRGVAVRRRAEVEP